MNFLLLVLIPIFIGMYAQMRISSAYQKNSRIRARSGCTGREVAELVLRSAGIGDVRVQEIAGHLTDHYDPARKVLALSSENFNGTSLAALGVAAHEAGHALQHQQHYAPLKLRMALIPVTTFASQLLPIVMLAGFFLFHSIAAIYVGVGIYLVLTLFQLVTLPVEFNASARAKVQLKRLGVISASEMGGVDETLDAAAFTYVAAFISSLGWMLYLLSAARNQR